MIDVHLVRLPEERRILLVQLLILQGLLVPPLPFFPPQDVQFLAYAVYTPTRENKHEQMLNHRRFMEKTSKLRFKIFHR